MKFLDDWFIYRDGQFFSFILQPMGKNLPNVLLRCDKHIKIQMHFLSALKYAFCKLCCEKNSHYSTIRPYKRDMVRVSFEKKSIFGSPHAIQCHRQWGHDSTVVHVEI